MGEVLFCADSSLPYVWASVWLWLTPTTPAKRRGLLLPAPWDQRDHGTFEQKDVIRTMWLCSARSSAESGRPAVGGSRFDGPQHSARSTWHLGDWHTWADFEHSPHQTQRLGAIYSCQQPSQGATIHAWPLVVGQALEGNAPPPGEYMETLNFGNIIMTEGHLWAGGHGG